MKANEIKNVTCLGGGTIGASWAVSFAMNGLNVIVYDITDEALAYAKGLVERSAKTLADCEVVDEKGAEELCARVSYTTNVEEALKNAQYIQESVPENLAVKHATVENIEKYAPADAIVGSSASRMQIGDICAPAQHKERYTGAHPYNPPHLVPLVEICPGADTSEETKETIYEFFKLLKKEPIMLHQPSIGFVGNRLQAVLFRELKDLVGRGVVSLEDANKAVTFGPGFRWGVMGPTLVFDLGNAKGIKGLGANVSGSGLNTLDYVATWTKNPHPAISAERIEELRRNVLPEETHESREAAAEWRDHMLIKALRAHGKL